MFGFAKSKHAHTEREKMARLEQAEVESDSIKERAVQVHRRLDDRQRRNHWREAVEQMIQGVT